ncbi:hypothetical protein FXO38_16200 [Capsicum annuum]|uniref:Uncharacterized protein n=1 Tax=Capsicum annuum TaxID=4072 RepID=A0A2G2YIX1_CAPAN|nr:hypothetical protein FXO38_16200 [Capsicum annuum]PHT69687.1 hypothetical protein T459_24791 [Capsicum annuum]
MILVYFILLVFLQLSSNFAANENFDNYVGCDMPKSDVDLVEFPLNLEYLEAEFFLWGSLGYGLDKFAPELAGSGPPPIGAQIAKLSPLVRDVITQFGFQEVGHLRVEKVYYTLDLCATSKIHPVFHIFQLKKKLGSNIASVTLLVVQTNSGPILRVPEAIINRRLSPTNGQAIEQILIKWMNVADEDST